MWDYENSIKYICILYKKKKQFLFIAFHSHILTLLVGNVCKELL